MFNMPYPARVSGIVLLAVDADPMATATAPAAMRPASVRLRIAGLPLWLASTVIGALVRRLALAEPPVMCLTLGRSSARAYLLSGRRIAPPVRGIAVVG